MPEFFGNGDQQVRNGTHTVRFGAFEADLHSGEVRKAGARIKLQEQPFKVLQILLERPGALVTRDELQSRIWPTDNFGDFDHAVNVAVGKLRTALGDCADDPHFIETVPRRGYRFVAKLDEAPIEGPLERANGTTHPVSLAAATAVGAPLVGALPNARAKRAMPIVLALAGAALLLGTGVWLGHRTTHLQAPEFQRLTVQHGTVDSARFTPDGHGVLYGAAWDAGPVEIYSTDLKSTGARKMEMPDTALLAVSSTSEVAVLQSADPRFMMTMRGTLAQVPITGGSPRQIAESVEWADWAPDGKTLAVVRDAGTKRRLEFPLGHLLYETNGWISHPRISPKGDTIAFLDHPSQDDDQGIVSLVDLAGHKTVLSTGWESEEGLAWSPDGREVWFSATEAGLERRIYAVDLAGHQRLAYHALGGVTLQDIAPDGRVLLTRDENRAGMLGMAEGASKEQDLSWLDWSLPVDLSRDGKTLLFDEQGEQSGPTYTVAMRNLQGAPPTPLGEGMAGDLSPDGKWAATVVSYTQIMLLPTGAGMVKRVDRGPIQRYGHQIHWMADGKQIVFPGNLPGHAARCFIQNIDGNAPRAITPEGVAGCELSSDDRTLIGYDLATATPRLYPMDGGPPHAISGLLSEDSFTWSADPDTLYVYQSRQLPLRIYRLNVLTGARQFLREIHPADPTGLCHMSHVLLSGNGKSYVYTYIRMLSDLYVVKGLK
jgi:eukaryotic-like serine/threonine-protein kinase